MVAVINTALEGRRVPHVLETQIDPSDFKLLSDPGIQFIKQICRELSLM
jgi:hypothetical protein